MPIPSQYPGTCKDCGTTHAVGDMIDKNGNSSINKNGEMKHHWCKNGMNCQGAMKLDNTPISTVVDTRRPNILSEDLEIIFGNVSGDGEEWDVLKVYIRVLNMCERMNITEPPVIGMIFNKTMDRLN